MDQKLIFGVAMRNLKIHRKDLLDLLVIRYVEIPVVLTTHCPSIFF